jgi:hypothetical protein
LTSGGASSAMAQGVPRHRGSGAPRHATHGFGQCGLLEWGDAAAVTLMKEVIGHSGDRDDTLQQQTAVAILVQ